MLLRTPPAKERYLADDTPQRVAQAKKAHIEALRKLAGAAGSAAAHGATWDEIREAVEKGVAEQVTEDRGYQAVAAATARARVHGGDDSI